MSQQTNSKTKKVRVWLHHTPLASIMLCYHARLTEMFLTMGVTQYFRTTPKLMELNIQLSDGSPIFLSQLLLMFLSKKKNKTESSEATDTSFSHDSVWHPGTSELISIAGHLCVKHHLLKLFQHFPSIQASPLYILLKQTKQKYKLVLFLLRVSSIFNI